MYISACASLRSDNMDGCHFHSHYVKVEDEWLSPILQDTTAQTGNFPFNATLQCLNPQLVFLVTDVQWLCGTSNPKSSSRGKVTLFEGHRLRSKLLQPLLLCSAIMCTHEAAYPSLGQTLRWLTFALSYCIYSHEYISLNIQYIFHPDAITSHLWGSHTDQWCGVDMNVVFGIQLVLLF